MGLNEPSGKEKLINPSPDQQCTSQLQNISETPLFPLNLQEQMKICKMLFLSSLPISLSNMSTLIFAVISLGFIANYATPGELAGASLASAWGTTFYFGVCNSINVGFQVVASQLYGANKHDQLVKTFQKTLFIITILSPPLIIFINIINKLMTLLETDEVIIQSSQMYLLYIIPSLAANCYSDCMKSYLIARTHFLPQGIIQGIAPVLHFILCYVFVVRLEMPLIGTAIAKFIVNLTVLFCFILYLMYHNLIGPVIKTWSWSSLAGWQTYLKRLLTIGANNYAQWIVAGILNFMIGALNDEYAIGGYGLASNIVACTFIICTGNCQTMQTYLGNAIGAGWKNRAQKIMMAGFSLNLFLALLNTCWLIFGNEATSSLLTGDPETKHVLMTALYFYSVIHWADAFSEHLASVLKVLGREYDVFLIFTIAYFPVGVTSQWIFGFTFGYGYIGILMSSCLQVSLIFFLQLKKVVSLDWDDQIKFIEQRMDKELMQKEPKTENNYLEMKDIL